MKTNEYTIIDKHCSRITHEGLYNYINESGEIISNMWFDECLPFRSGCGRVRIGKKWNYIDRNGNELSKVWFDKVNSFKGDTAIAYIGEKKYLIQK
jgi:hypothetical protein